MADVPISPTTPVTNGDIVTASNPLPVTVVGGPFLPLSGGVMTGQIMGFVDGDATTPAFAVGQTDMGYYRRVAGTLTLTIGGARTEITATLSKMVSGMTFGWTTGAASSALDTGLSRVAANIVGVGTGAAGSTAGTLRAAALAAGGSDFTVTAVNVVSPTAPNRTLTISYGGTTYYLAAKTTND